jgi:acyl-CoA dehydrogenase
MFRHSVRRFFEKEVTPFVEEWEEAGIVPRSVWKKMGEQGFLCMSVPEEYGGLGADFLYSVILCEELARTRHSGLAAPLPSDVDVPYITSYASGELKHRYLPGCVSGEIITAVAMTEPNTGSDLASIRTTAVADGDEVVINARRPLSATASTPIWWSWRPGTHRWTIPHQALNLYLVEAGTPGFEKGKKIKKVGWKSQDTAELFFPGLPDSVRQPTGPAGSGLPYADGKAPAGTAGLRPDCRGGGRGHAGIHHGLYQRTDRLRPAHFRVPEYPVSGWWKWPPRSSWAGPSLTS